MKVIPALVLTLIGMVVFGITVPFAGLFGPIQTLILRAVLLIVLGSLWLTGRGAAEPYRPVFFAYFAIVAGLTVSHYGVQPVMEWLHLGFTPMSNALAKAVGAGMVCGTIIILAFLTGQRFESLYLSAGRLGFGVTLGLAGFFAMAVVTFIPGGPFFKPGVLDVALVAKVAPWVLTFVLSNAFMEELLFRGMLLKRYEALVGPGLALLSTTLVFALAHVSVNYTARVAFFVAFVFGVGLLWGLLMQKSKSIWGSVLFHAGADVAVILPMYQAMLGH